MSTRLLTIIMPTNIYQMSHSQCFVIQIQIGVGFAMLYQFILQLFESCCGWWRKQHCGPVMAETSSPPTRARWQLYKQAVVKTVRHHANDGGYRHQSSNQEHSVLCAGVYLCPRYHPSAQGVAIWPPCRSLLTPFDEYCEHQRGRRTKPRRIITNSVIPAIRVYHLLKQKVSSSVIVDMILHILDFL